MDVPVQLSPADHGVETGLRAVAAIAGYFRIPADPGYLRRELALHGESAERRPGARRLASVPVPAILRDRCGQYLVLLAHGGGTLSLLDLHTRQKRELDAAAAELEPLVILVGRRTGGPGSDPRPFGFGWFLPSLARYRKPGAAERHCGSHAGTIDDGGSTTATQRSGPRPADRPDRGGPHAP